MKRTNKILSLITLLAALTPAWTHAQTASVPKYVNFQAVLRDDAGNLIEDGFIDLEFKILDQDGDELYYELQPGVQVVRSAVNVLIGEGVEPGSSPSAPTGGIPFDAINPAGGTKFLQMKVGSNLPSDNMELGSVPYAMYAQRAIGIVPDITEPEVPAVFVTESELATYSSNIINTINTSGGSTTIVESVIDPTIMRDSEAEALFVNVTGDTMTGDLNMSNQNITNVNQVDGVNLNTLNSTVSNHTSQISTLNSTTSTHTTQINTLSTTATDHENRLDALEAKPEIRAWVYVEDPDGNLGAKSFTGYNIASVDREDHFTFGKVYKITFSNSIGLNYAANATANRDIDNADRLFANVPGRGSSIARVRIKEESSGQDYGNFSFTAIK